MRNAEPRNLTRRSSNRGQQPSGAGSGREDACRLALGENVNDVANITKGSVWFLMMMSPLFIFKFMRRENPEAELSV